MQQLDEINSERSEEMLVNNERRQSLENITTNRDKYKVSHVSSMCACVCLSMKSVCMFALVKVKCDL